MTTTPRLWNSLTQVNTTDGDKNQFESEITPLQDGGYVVVWTDLSHTYNPLGEAVVGQRYDAAGNKVGGRGQAQPVHERGPILARDHHLGERRRCRGVRRFVHR